jgi:hypothetical protein
MFPEQKEILAAIADFQAGKIDALRLAERVDRLATALDPEHNDDDLTTFVAVHSETDRLLIGDPARGWHESVREEREQEYAKAEQFYRESVTTAASSLVHRWGPTA